MSVPPPPNQWGAQPPAGGPQWGPPPSGAPQWVPPPNGGGKGKWIFGGIALLAVIAVTVVITVLVVGKDSGGTSNPTPTNGNGSDFASANDKGPVGIITEDPTCDAWGRIAREYSAQAESVKWADRDQTVPSDAWTCVWSTFVRSRQSSASPRRSACSVKKRSETMIWRTGRCCGPC